jgi:hypothetical protein
LHCIGGHGYDGGLQTKRLAYLSIKPPGVPNHINPLLP